jgi:hypothetical protein
MLETRGDFKRGGKRDRALLKSITKKVKGAKNPQKWSTFPRNRRQLCSRMGGRFLPELVAGSGLLRNIQAVLFRIS